jgi:DNA-binding transcriptional MerR regulator
LARIEKDLPNPETLFLEAQPRLTFGVKAAAVGCGISVRQLDWWTRVGYVPVLQNGRHRRYSSSALKIALLIKYGLSQGMSLRKSADFARKNFPQLWESETELMSESEADSAEEDELSTIRMDIARLSSELTEASHRLSRALGYSEEAEEEIAEEEE